jgi:hypothetical protein
MSRPPSDLSFTDIEIALQNELSPRYRIRNGRLWGILKNRQLAYVDLNNKPKPQVHLFPEVELSKCIAIFVSSDGAFCLVTVDSSAPFLIRASNLRPRIVPTLPKTIVTTATFFQVDAVPTPHLFMGTDKGLVTYINLKSDELTRVNIIPVANPPPQPAVGLSMVKFGDGTLGLSIITEKQMYPFFLDRDFMEKPSNSKMIPYLNGTLIYVERNLIGTLMQEGAASVKKYLFLFILPVESDSPQIGRLYSVQKSLTLKDDIYGFCTADEIPLAYNDKGYLQVFTETHDNEVAHILVPGAIGFEYDSDAGELYAVFPRKVQRIRFDLSGRTRGSDSIRFWLYNRCLAEKKDQDGIAILSRLSLPFDEVLKMVGKSEEQRLRLLQSLLVRIRQKKIRNHRTVAIAVMAIDLFARVECARAKPKESDFIEFAEGLLADQLIDLETVKKVLIDYGWDRPLAKLGDEVTMFKKLMERGAYAPAQEQLRRIVDDQRFCDCALRLFGHAREEVVQAVGRRESVENEKLAPILMSDEARPIVCQLFQTGRLTKPWLCRAYSIAVSKAPSEALIEPFFKKFAYSKDGDIPAMARCLITERQFLMLAYGLRANNDLVGAVAVAAKGDGPKGDAAQGDAVSAFDIIPPGIEPELKKRCAMRILRSLERKKAELVAQKLVNEYAGAGVDVPTLLQFLPDDLPIAKLDVVLAEFTKAKNVAAEEQKGRFTGSKSGIERAQKLMANRTEKISSLSSTEPCERCKRPFFSEPGIVYPCSHVLHMTCAAKLAKMVPLLSGDDPIDIKADCPFCGFLSIRLLASPYARPPEGESEADAWSTDFDRLLADESIWKRLGGLKF